MEINLFVLLKMYNGYLILDGNSYNEKYVFCLYDTSIWCSKVDKSLKYLIL